MNQKNAHRFICFLMLFHFTRTHFKGCQRTIENIKKSSTVSLNMPVILMNVARNLPKKILTIKVFFGQIAKRLLSLRKGFWISVLPNLEHSLDNKINSTLSLTFLGFVFCFRI